MDVNEFLLALIGFIIATFIVRIIFRIGTIVKQLKAQTELLALIAIKQGAYLNKVNSIMKEAEGTTYELPQKDKLEETEDDNLNSNN